MFCGRFVRLGEKTGWKGRVDLTVLLADIIDITGTPICDHLWFNYTAGFEAAELEPGDWVEFRARVKEYEKGYQGRRSDVYKPVAFDYKLSHPTKIRKIAAPSQASIAPSVQEDAKNE